MKWTEEEEEASEILKRCRDGREQFAHQPISQKTAITGLEIAAQ
jgi:hypothetical protein